MSGTGCAHEQAGAARAHCVDGGRVRFGQNAAGDIQADEWRVLDHARRARSPAPLPNRSVGRIGRRRIRPESDRLK